MSHPQKTVLVVDDDIVQSSSVEAKLVRDGFKVIAASNGEMGLKTALKEKPDMILLDIMMPKMDGISMLKKLREDAWGKTANVIMLTNLGNDTEKMADAMESNVLEYLIKTEHNPDSIASRVKARLGIQ